MTGSPAQGTRIRLDARIPERLAGRRLDQALAELFAEYSRSRLKSWIVEGAVRVDGQVPRPRDRLLGGERIEIDAELVSDGEVSAEAIGLSVVHQDDALLVIDKPAGLVVHPGAGNKSGTVQHGLLHLDPRLAELPRCGIVHRLDKDTTGLMVVARTLQAHTSLVAQLQAREVRREYLALCYGEFSGGGSIDAPIGRHPRDRVRMAVTPRGKPAVTHYRVARRFPGVTLLRVMLHTGRTHQIRVHLAHLRHPLVGDPTYGGRPRLPPAIDQELRDALRAFPRQALHAERLSLAHPTRGELMTWCAPLPADLQRLLDLLGRAAGGEGVVHSGGQAPRRGRGA